MSECDLVVPTEFIRSIIEDIEKHHTKAWSFVTPLGNVLVVERHRFLASDGEHDVLEFTYNPGD